MPPAMEAGSYSRTYSTHIGYTRKVSLHILKFFFFLVVMMTDESKAVYAFVAKI